MEDHGMWCALYRAASCTRASHTSVEAFVGVELPGPDVGGEEESPQSKAAEPSPPTVTCVKKVTDDELSPMSWDSRVVIQVTDEEAVLEPDQLW